jgi:hypothetical protein
MATKHLYYGDTLGVLRPHVPAESVYLVKFVRPMAYWKT